MAVVNASYHRNPFGIPEDAPEFDELLAQAWAEKTHNPVNLTKARDWLEQWQEENPVVKATAPQKPKTIRVLWDQLHDAVKKLFDGHYELLLAYAAGDRQKISKFDVEGFLMPFHEVIQSLNLDRLKEVFSELSIEEKTVFMLATEVYTEAENAFNIFADMIEGKDISVEERSEAYSWLSNLLALTIESRKLIP